MTTATIGDNSKNAPIKEQMELRYPEIFARLNQLEAAAVVVPEKLKDDDESGKAQDLVKMMRVAIKQADSTRDIEKEPYAQAVKEVNAAFRIPMERLEKVQKELMRRVEVYLDEKKERERLAREEAARKQREEAERLAREAEEAERRRLEAQRQREAEERKAREAEAAKLKAIADAKAAEERAAAAKAEAARLEIEAKARQARQEAERAAEAERLAEVRKHREAEEAKAREAREAAAKAREEQAKAEAAAKAAKQEQREAERDEKATFGQAVRAEKRADRLDESAKASDADLARTRGELGTVGTMARRWTFKVKDYGAVPLDKLRPFLATDAIDAAIFRLMQTGVRELPGVEFEQVSEARIA